MKKLTYEQKALYYGVGINFYSTFVGFIFFAMTKSASLLLDGLISAVLCFSTVISVFVSKYLNKGDSKNYPLGTYAIENMFLLFRALLMLATIIWTIVDGINVIVSFANGSLVSDLNISMEYLLIYMALMVSSCLAITFTYSYFNKKMIKQEGQGSEIVKLEIKASIYDGLVTVVACSSLLIFNYIPFFSPIKDIGDAITSIILSVIYLYTPIKELIRQIKVLTDKRRDVDVEKGLYKELNKEFNNFKYYDIYFSYSGDITSIYITLMPKKDMDFDLINANFSDISNYLYDKYPSSKVFLLLSDKMLHML